MGFPRIEMVSNALERGGDAEDLSMHFINAFIQMQERGFNFTPESLEPLELASLLAKMNSGINDLPSVVGPIPYPILDKVTTCT